MDTLERAFARIGARVKFEEILPNPRATRKLSLDAFSLDVRRDARGEYFLVSRAPKSATEFLVLDVQPQNRHLLLLSRTGGDNHRFLLGHDERHWFVAGIPETAAISRVADAMQALKPVAVLDSERGLRSKERDSRRNRARTRQGEWFFVSIRDVRVPAWLILRDEPLIRSGGGKAHICDELYRFGGETVYVNNGHPNGLTEGQYRNLPDDERKGSTFRVMRRNPKVYVRGRVRHPDHKTVVLDNWNQVLSNTEDQSYAMRNIVFLD